MTDSDGVESRSGEGTARLRASERLVALRARVGRFVRGRERLLFVAAFLLFCAALVLAIRSLPSVQLVWPWLGLTAAMVPLAMALNGIEYYIAARLLGYKVGLGDAMAISILGSAANVLPIPGAVLVRMQALKQKGAAYGPALVATGAIGAGWLGAAMVLAGGLLLSTQRWGLSLALLVCGAASGLVMVALVRTNRRKAVGPALAILCVEVTFVLVSGARLYGVLHGLGIEASPIQAVALTVAAALAAAAGVFPEGLGLRELIAGGLSPLIGLPAAAGVLGAAVDRLIGLAVLSAGSLPLIVGRRRAGGWQPDSGPPEPGPGRHDQGEERPGGP